MNPTLHPIQYYISMKGGMKNRLPFWFKQDLPDEIIFSRLQILNEYKVNTICQLAKCPNVNYCLKNKEVTLLILGNRCTRDCRFCAVEKSKNGNLALDEEEPLRIGHLVKQLGLNYVVITSVTRDDLEDGGAKVFAQTIKLIKKLKQDIKIEVLIPDFSGSFLALKTVVNANPDVIGHNLETVRRLYGTLKPMADYGLSLSILAKIKSIQPTIFTKSSFMLGLGETEKEVIEAMRDLRFSQCDVLTLGQYLAPTVYHYPVKEFISLEKFARYQEIGLGLGFKSVLSGPLVRSSYKAQDLYKEVSYV